MLLELTSGLGYLNSITGWKRSSDSDKEVDFVIAGSLPVEVKATLNIQNKYVKGLIEYLELYDQAKGIVVSGDKYKIITIENKKIINVPAYALNSVSLVS